MVEDSQYYHRKKKEGAKGVIGGFNFKWDGQWRPK